MSTKSNKPKKINGELHYHENGQKLYEIANSAEIKGTYELDGLSPEEQLNFIKDDIIFRVKITPENFCSFHFIGMLKWC